MIAVDTNILIYAHRAEFPEHVAARKLLAGLAEGSELWALPVFCLGEFLPGGDPSGDPEAAERPACSEALARSVTRLALRPRPVAGILTANGARVSSGFACGRIRKPMPVRIRPAVKPSAIAERGLMVISQEP